MVTTRSGTKTASEANLWVHTPSTTTLVWLAVSLPLVIWDTGYIMFRPHTIDGGWLYWPLYVPYKLYGTVDLVYSPGAWEAKNGFTAAQGSLNVVETAMYLYYAYVYLTQAQAVPGKAKKAIVGRPAATAVLIAFSAAVMTVSKTALYWLQEYCSDYEHIGHNNLQDLILLWIIPNGLWLIFPTYMAYVMGSEIIEGLSVASAGVPLKSD